MVKYLKNNVIISEAVGLQEQDDVMLFNVTTENIFIVNYTAFLILEELSEEKSIFELINSIKSKYQVDETTLENDIQEIVEAFVEKNIVVVREC